MASSLPISARASYGLDAPGVVKGFFAAGLGLALVAVAIVSSLRGAWADLGWAALVVAFVPLGLGSSMLAYSFAGKMRLRDRLLALRVWRGDETVLDVGAGRGLMAIAAARRVPRGRVYALDVWSARDLSGNTREALVRNATSEGVADRIAILDADAREIPLPDASVDVVASVFCIHNIEPETERRRALGEIVRVLKFDGVALIADFPGAGAYVAPLRDAGFDVRGPFRAERTALGVAGYIVATKLKPGRAQAAGSEATA